MLEVLTAVLVMITGFYAWATFRILRANDKVVSVMEEQAVAMGRPYVTVTPFVLPGTPLISLKIANTGQSAATNLRLIIDRDFYKFAEKQESKNIANFKAFREPIEMFAPGTELTFDLAQGFKMFGNGADSDVVPTTFTITASYEFSGKKVEERNVIDLRPFEESTQPRDLIVSELKEIRKAIEKIKE
jgi:hypothetical protein